MWKSKKKFTLLLASMIVVSNPKTHMHKSTFHRLLKVIFKNEKGNIDSSVWYVRNLD
ncbi:MAG: hypothetical protein ACFFG0_37445 [Candidatus Thorarchaeota archaeon]